MSEQTTVRPQRQEPPRSAGGPGGLDDGDGGGPPGTVTVGTGAYYEALPVAGMTVAQIRRRFADRFDIDPQATVSIDGQPADEQATLRAGQVLTFLRLAGEKGLERVP